MTAAASKYSGGAPPSVRNDSGSTPGASVTSTEKLHAASVPIAISVNMFRFHVATDCQPRTRNGQPAYNTTGVARKSSSQPMTVWPNTRIGSFDGQISPSIGHNSG